MLKDNAGSTTITDKKAWTGCSLSKHFQIEHVSTLKFLPNFTIRKKGLKNKWLKYSDVQ